MKYIYNFSLNKMMKLIEDNISHCGTCGIEIDAKILYYYLIQKYDKFRIEDVLDKILQISKMDSKDVQDMLSFLADN